MDWDYVSSKKESLPDRGKIDYLSGHRRVMFSDDLDLADECPPPLPPGVAVLLIENNRIVASSAPQGRYAEGELFFARDHQKYAQVYERCAGEATLRVLPHLRGVALLGGALAKDTGLLIAYVVMENAKRTLRLLRRCFSIFVDMSELDEGQLPESTVSLRQSDAVIHTALQQLLAQYRSLCRSLTKDVCPTTQAALVELVRRRMQPIYSMLGLPEPEWRGVQEYSFPCMGTVNAAALFVLLFGFGTMLRAQGTPPRGEAAYFEIAPDRLHPQLVLPLTAEQQKNVDAWLRRPLLYTLSCLALRHKTVFMVAQRADDSDSVRIELRFSPLTPAHAELYTLRSHKPWRLWHRGDGC